MKGIVIYLLLFSSSIVNAAGQINLVRNGDFETYSKCPSQANQITLATGWFSVDTIVKDSFVPNRPTCSGEYYNVCGRGGYSIPLNSIGHQDAHSGAGMIGVGFYSGVGGIPPYYYLRDYAQAKLIKNLTMGKRYCVTFYVSLAEISDRGIKEISSYFDNGSIDTAKYCGLPQTRYTPQVTYSGLPITDTMNWTKVEGSFVAKGTEQFITLGNFKDNNTTTIDTIPKTDINGAQGTYYYIDDVSVVESDLPADAGPDTHVANDSVYIGRPMSDAIWCDWRVLGSSTIIGQGPGIKVKPKVRTRYVVTQNLCGNITRDTVTIDVWPAGVNNVKGKEQRYELTPNPVQSVIHVSQSIHDERQVQLSLCEASGQVVYSSCVQFLNGQCSLDLPSLAAGFYFLRLQDGWGNGFVMKMVKE